MTDSAGKFARALRAFDTIPGVVVEPQVTMGQRYYLVTMTDEARATIAEMIGVRPPMVEVTISQRVIGDMPLFTHRVITIDPEPNQEGNEP